MTVRIPPEVRALLVKHGIEESPEMEDFIYALGKRWLGLDFPFICGVSDERDDEDGLPLSITICPAFGLDGICIYEKKGKYSAPGW